VTASPYGMGFKGPVLAEEFRAGHMGRHGGNRL
jgi:hypothetical protein